MMNRLKALIKMEMKPALLMGILFLSVNILGLLMIQGRVNSMWNNYLNNGLSDFYWGALINITGGNFFQNSFTVGILYMILLIILVFSTFRYEKSVEISRFLKSLPYTERERCLVKVGVGVGVLTISLLVYMVGLLYLRHYSMGLFQEIMEVTALGSIAEKIFDLGELLRMLALMYVVLMAIYLFMIMVQYMVSSRFGGIIIGMLSAAAPLFMAMSLWNMLDFSSRDTWIGEVLDGFIYLMAGFTRNIWLEDGFLGYNTYLSGFSYHITFYVVIIMLVVTVILYFTKNNRLEDSDLLMPHSVVRIIFIVGVSICSGFSSCFILSVFFRNILFSTIPTIIQFIVGVVIGFLIAKKIAYIGIKKRKEVKA